MALCRTCDRLIPCHCHATPPVELAPGVYLDTSRTDHPKDTTVTQPDTERALHLVASNRLAAASALQRWMNITFPRATELLDELHQQGWVGPANGSGARTLHAQYCQQCGRIGRRGYRAYPAEDFGGPPLIVCANKAACRKRWPKPTRDDA